MACLALAVLAIGACGATEPEPLQPLDAGAGPASTTTAAPPSTTAPDTAAVPNPSADEAHAAATHFLATYVEPHGRVVRHNEGGDTVSEGQAYAMLIAAAIGDRDTFDRVWGWTADHLQRDDGLLAWHWRHGTIVDAQSATDADLDAAHALFLAAAAFDEPEHRVDGARLAAAILEHATVGVSDGRLLVAGPWALHDRTVNPSYFSPLAYSILFRNADDDRWGRVAATSRAIVDSLTTDAPHLPPDWATATDPATPIASGAPPTFGFDASRTLLRFAIDCDPAGRELAARSWAFFAAVTDGGQRAPAATYLLDGTPRTTDPHASTTVAAAASAHAAGELDASRRLLALATAHDREHPTYYGAAIVALGRIGLDTDGLGSCA